MVFTSRLQPQQLASHPTIDPSELNLHYLDRSGRPDRPRHAGGADERPLLRHSLESLGYTTVVFDNGFGLPEISDAEITLTPDKHLCFAPVFPVRKPDRRKLLFARFLRCQTGIPLPALRPRLLSILEHSKRKSISWINCRSPGGDGPKFVFAHLMMPHPPY